MSLRHTILALALALTTLAGLDACGYDGTSSSTGINLSGNYTIISFSDAQNGGQSPTVTGTLAATTSTYKFNIVASILPIAFADSGAYTLYGSTITLVSLGVPPLPNCAGTFLFRDHSAAGSDTLTIDCIANGDRLISVWVK